MAIYSDGMSYSLEGLKPVLDRFEALPGELRYKGARFAGRKAARVIEKEAKANAAAIDDPATPESIAANITVRFDRRYFRRTRDLKFSVGVRKANRKTPPGGDTFYWWWQEFGTSKLPAKRYMQRALEQNIDAATAEFGRELEKWMDRNVDKLLARGGGR